MSPAQLQTALQNGLDHHVAGRAREAEASYRQVLTAAPNQPDALHLLGVLALQHGQYAAAIDLIGKSVQIAPGPAPINNLGEALRAMKRNDEATACYHRSIELNPNQADAYSNLAIIYQQENKLAEAEGMLRAALKNVPNHPGATLALAKLLEPTTRLPEIIAAWEAVNRLQPNNADVYRVLGTAYQRSEDWYRAITAFRRSIELNPNNGEAHSRLSGCLLALGKIEEAEPAARRGVELAPKMWASFHDFGQVLEQQNKWDDAREAYATAVSLNPNSPGLIGCLANCYAKLDRFDEARETFLRGAQLSPNDARFYWSLSKLHFRQHEFRKALEFSDQAIAVAPHDPEGHASRAFALLADGNYLDGFKEYEWRWRSSTFTTKPRDFDRPIWDGSDLTGRTILVHSEQGFGDIFQFLRYVPLLSARGARVICEVPYKVANLVRRMPGIWKTVVSGTILPDFDLHTPMMSLPAVFGTSMETIPSSVPYLTPDPTLVRQWNEKLSQLTGIRVGIVWIGSKKPDPKRSAALSDFAPLADVPGISLIAMQPEPNDSEADKPPGGLKLLNLGPQLRDFADTTASVLANLDLLITIDTGVAHLAGAMGVKTWVLLPYSPDWRWHLDRSDTPWYPTMRVFRQPKRDDWESVMRDVVAALRGE